MLSSMDQSQVCCLESCPPELGCSKQPRLPAPSSSRLAPALRRSPKPPLQAEGKFQTEGVFSRALRGVSKVFPFLFFFFKFSVEHMTISVFFFFFVVFEGLNWGQ